MDRRLRRPIVSALAAVLGVGAAHAAPLSTSVDEVTVVAAHEPAIAATYPASDEAVGSGLLVLKIGFTVPMSPASWSLSPIVGLAYPQCLPRPRLLADRKTFVLLCSVGARTDYAVGLNTGAAAPGFVGLGNRRAPAFTLRFKTVDTATVSSLALAMAAASLKDDESPLMGAGDPPAPRIAAR